MRIRIAALAILAGIALATPTESQITSYVGVPGSGSVDGTNPDMTPDGRFVAYESAASNIVSGDTNGDYDCFVHDRVADTVTRVSVGPGGAQATNHSRYPTISDDGMRVAFESVATDLVIVDTNNRSDVFVHDLATNVTTRVSVNSTGAEATGHSYRPVISGNGRFVAFWSDATDLVAGDTNGASDVFVHDLDLALTVRVSVSSFGLQGDGFSRYPSISANGRWVAFESTAITLTLNDTNGVRDIFVRDRAMNQTFIVSRSSDGTPSDGTSFEARVSADGSRVAFTSQASTFDGLETVPGSNDVFRHTLATGETERVSVDAQGGIANGGCGYSSISPSGRYITFRGTASDLTSTPDSNGKNDIFIRDMDAELTTMVSLPTGGGTPLEGLTAVSTSDGRFIVFDGATDNRLHLRDTFVPWSDLGFALAGSQGDPALLGDGTLQANTIVSLTLSDGVANAPAYLIGSPNLLLAPFEGGKMVPQPTTILPLSTDATGGFYFPVLWPPNVPSGNSFYLQCWIVDPGGIYGYSSSNGISLTQP